MAWVAPERILFALPKIGSKLELFLMRPLQAKFGKICQWTKKIKDAVVYGWNRQIFPKSPKENRNSLNKSTACLFKKIDGQYAFTGKHHCLQKRFIFFTQEFSLVVWLHVRPENKTKKKNGQCRIWVFGMTKKKIRSSVTYAILKNTL